MNSQHNPQLLTAAREAAGLTQSELASKLGIAQATLSKYEAGLVSFDENTASSLASALGVTVDFFNQTDCVYGFGSSCFYHRKRTSMPATTLRKVQARLNLLRMHVARLMKSFEVATEKSFVRLDIDDYGSPETVAQAMRQHWGIPKGPVPNVTNLIEQAGAIICPARFPLFGFDAITQSLPGHIPLMMIDPNAPGDRLRFTLMHEVGHIVMHYFPTGDMENDADRFAAEFLMPASDIKNSLRSLRVTSLIGLKMQWKVSIAALIRRAYTLECITERRYRSLITEISMQGWKKNEPVSVERESPTVLRNMIDAHIHQLGYSIDEVASLLHCGTDLVEEYLDSPLSVGLRVIG